jgi:hypothetical protein
MLLKLALKIKNGEGGGTAIYLTVSGYASMNEANILKTKKGQTTSSHYWQK